MKFDVEALAILTNAVNKMGEGFSSLPDLEPCYDLEKINKVIQETADKMKDNYPYFHPYYAGQMLKPPHPVAKLAYMLSMWINPNNHALDGGRASSQMEKEAVAQIAGLFGWTDFLGHLCGGGTMANLEALWISGNLCPNSYILASEQAHYTHSRISEVLKLKFKSVQSNSKSRMDLNALEDLLGQGSVGTVVVTLGTTGTGSLDPLPDILKLKKKYDFRIHVDAAYGGYFILADNISRETREAFDCLSQVDSIVIDPHKHGLQPYGCGCILFKDPGVGRFYKHDSPYTYFSSPELHLGEISLECSRPGASAVALWATQKLLPMIKGGEFASDLEDSISAAGLLYKKILSEKRFMTIMKSDLDIVIWAPAGKKASEISRKSKEFFELAARQNLHLAVFSYPSRLLKEIWENVEFDEEQVTCLRSCLMKPEHLQWMDKIWSIMEKILAETKGI